VQPADRVVLDLGPTANRYGWAVLAAASLLWLGTGLVGVLSKPIPPPAARV
jgi:hypothetical protein